VIEARGSLYGGVNLLAVALTSYLPVASLTITLEVCRSFAPEPPNVGGLLNFSDEAIR